MSLKLVFALVSSVALCCAQTDATSPSGFPAKESAAPVPPATAPAVPTAPSPTAPAPATSTSTGAATTTPTPPPTAPAPAAATPEGAPEGDDQPAPGKVTAGGRSAGAKPDSSHKAYVIGPLDVLQVKVWNNANLSGMVAVDTDGTISIPLIGEIKADGLTQRQLKDKISERLRDFFNNNPDVDVTLAKINSKRYFVYGGVGRAGEFPLAQETTVMDALSNTGGFKDFANKKKIYILRGTQRFNFNYNEVSKGKHLEENIVLENGDRIFVPE